MDWNAKLAHQSLPRDVRELLRAQVRAKIEEGQRALGIDILLKDDHGAVMTPENTPLPQLYSRYKKLAARQFTVKLDEAAKAHSPTTEGQELDQRFQLYLDVKLFMAAGLAGEEAELHFTILNTETLEPLYEDFVVGLSGSGLPTNPALIGRLKCLFVDLKETKLHTYALVCRSSRVSNDLLFGEEREKKNPGLRRPFALGLLLLESLLDSPGEQAANMYLHVGREDQLTALPRLILDGLKVSDPSKAPNVAVSLQAFRGKFHELAGRQTQLSYLPRCQPLILQPEAFYPSFQRNDFYVTLDKADFSPSRPQNVYLNITLRSTSGTFQSSALSGGVGDEFRMEFKSMLCGSVFPIWPETLKLQLPKDAKAAQGWHLLFELRQAQKGKTKEAFALAYLPLYTPAGVVIRNDLLKLPLYKPTRSFETDTGYLDGKQPLRKGEYLQVSVSVASTAIIQSPLVLNLLDHKATGLPLGQVLHDFMYTEQLDIVRSIRPLLQVLFNLLCEQPVGPDRGLAFKAVVYVYGAMMDERGGVSLAPVLDHVLQTNDTRESQLLIIFLTHINQTLTMAADVALRDLGALLKVLGRLLRTLLWSGAEISMLVALFRFVLL